MKQTYPTGVINFPKIELPNKIKNISPDDDSNVLPFKTRHDQTPASLIARDLDKVRLLEDRGLTRELGALAQGAMLDMSFEERDKVTSRHLSIIENYADRNNIEAPQEPELNNVFEFPEQPDPSQLLSNHRAIEPVPIHSPKIQTIHTSPQLRLVPNPNE